MGEEISTRLIALRKHLGERLNEKLTMELVAERSHLNEQQVYRLEHGLNGTPVSLLSLLQFYVSHGYNMNWIVCPDNSRTPMLMTSGTEMQTIGELISQLSKDLESGRAKLNAQLRQLGYIPLGEQPGTVVESDVHEAIGLVL